jgi:NAD(P)-dependent dehydrogenase (short-subunit alcohol dehydrogenase family)
MKTSSRSLKELMSLNGRVALITGGAGHIGLAMGEALAELGASVVVLDVAREPCEQATSRLHADYGVTTVPLVVDLADEAAVRSVPGAVLERLGRLDVLVHSAGWVGTVQSPGWAVPFDRQTVAAWDAAMRVNLTSAFILVQEAKQALAESTHGSVILVASIYGRVGPDMRLYDGTSMANPAAYGVSKAGLLQLTRYLATVLAPQVRVNAISPGGVWRGQPEIFHERYRQRTPLGRMATEEDLKGAVAYLASDLSAYVTGQELIVDGGWTAW